MDSTAELVDIWRHIIVGEDKSWVLFTHGTCVILMEPAQDLAAQAVELLREFGPVRAGGPAGDFNTIDLDVAPGWVVTGHHPDVLNYIGPEDVGDPNDLVVGLAGRAARDQDATVLTVIHIEDKRR